MPVPSHLTEMREQEVQQALRNLRALPALVRSEAGDEDSCPICLVPLESLFEEHDVTEGKQEGPSISPRITTGTCSSTSEMTGVVKLDGCGHIFCRKDLAEWVESHHGSCPACRQTFFIFTPIDEAEYESSDGGEYVPDEDDDEDIFTDDGDVDLIASSDYDVDHDMDNADSGSDDEADGYIRPTGYAPLARVPASSTAEAEANRRRAALLYAPHPGDDYRVYAAEDEDFEADEENVDRELVVDEYANELSYGSDAASSEGTSFTTEEGHEITDVGMVSEEYGADEANDELSSDIEIVEVKSPVVSTPGSSNSSTNITQ